MVSAPNWRDSRYEVKISRSVGKPPRYWDIVLLKKTAYGAESKGTSKIVRAWHGCYGDGRAGTPHDLALKEAHALRDKLDAYIHYLAADKRRTGRPVSDAAL